MGFGIIMIGYIFILFDFNINGINLLPNVIGWIMVLIGMSRIYNKLKNNYFKQGLQMVFLLIILASFEIATRYVDSLS
ncbi:MAG: hypothetical protein ACI35O_13455, partial [Bacillaceae bacterium]